MGLKCSVLGHAYGETTVERDREEQGSEVVITIREVETCERCGTERVVSENKEVTAIETPDDESLDAAPDDAEDADEDADADEASAEPAETGEELSASEIVGADDDADGESVEDDADDADDASEAEEPATATVDDDADTGAEILDAESEEPVEDETVDEELSDPTIDPEVDNGAESVDEDADDAVIIDDGDDEDEAAEPGDRQPGEWPEEPDSGDDEWRPDTIGTIEEDDEDAPTEATTLTVPDGQFRCPECDFTTLVESSSLRRGDFCPECHRGTLVHEPQDETRKE